MKVLFTSRGWRHYLYWNEYDRRQLTRINTLIEEIRRTPFKGIGKPEPLKQQLKGFWSRRIDLEHRLVYRVIGSGDDQRIEIVQCRYHYEKNG